jgi:hypothetical protein
MKYEDKFDKFDELLRKLIRMVEREDPKPLTRNEKNLLAEIDDEMRALFLSIKLELEGRGRE